MNSLKPILVCGDAMVDEYWVGDVARISPEAPVPVVLVTKQEDRFGAADNVAANVRALGCEFHTAVCSTSRKIRLVARNQQVARIDFDFRPRDVGRMEAAFRAALPQCGVVVFSDYGKGSLVHIQTLIREAKSLGKLVLVDPKGHDYRKYAGADLVKPNLDEMRHMMGGWGSEEQLAAKISLLMGEADITRILLTRGAGGMSLYTEKDTFHVESVSQEVYDVTGAGDTAIACLAVCLNRGMSWLTSMDYANKAAGIVCGKFGTAVATKEEVFNGLG